MKKLFLIVIVAAALVAAGVFLMKNKAAENPQPNQSPNLTNAENYPRTMELFKTCTRIDSLKKNGLTDEEILKLPNEKLGEKPYSGDIYIFTEKDLEKIFSLNELNIEDFEETLNKGRRKENERWFSTFGENSVGSFCKNDPSYAEDKDSIINTIIEGMCRKKSSCCNLQRDLPEPKDIVSSQNFIKKFLECLPFSTDVATDIATADIRNLKYGHLINFSSNKPPTYLILTDTGCVFDCFAPNTVLSAASTKEGVEIKLPATEVQNEESIKGSRIKADLSQVRAIAEMIQVDNNSYVDLCETPNNTLNQKASGYSSQLDAVEKDIDAQGSRNTCYAKEKSYCASASLVSPGAGYYCVDSGGRAFSTTTNTCDAANLDCL